MDAICRMERHAEGLGMQAVSYPAPAGQLKP